MQVRSIAAIPLSHPLEEGRSFGHPRVLADVRSTTVVFEEPFDPADESPSVPTGRGLGVTVDEDAVERYRVDRR